MAHQSHQGGHAGTHRVRLQDDVVVHHLEKSSLHLDGKPPQSRLAMRSEEDLCMTDAPMAALESIEFLASEPCLSASSSLWHGSLSGGVPEVGASSSVVPWLEDSVQKDSLHLAGRFQQRSFLEMLCSHGSRPVHPGSVELFFPYSRLASASQMKESHKGGTTKQAKNQGRPAWPGTLWATNVLCAKQ